MQLTIPELSLVVLIGTSGSGKSTFARRHFGLFEVVSSDFCRGLVSNDENNQAVTNEAFELMHSILSQRLKLGKLTVVDATNIRPEDRRNLVGLAREYHVLPAAIVFDIPEKVCQQRNEERQDRTFGPHVIRRQRTHLKRHIRGLKREGFRSICTFTSVEEVDSAEIIRQKLWNNKRDDHGPFDIIGDVHGCYDELCELLAKLGYSLDAENPSGSVSHPEGRKLVFLGDLVDRGPASEKVIDLVMNLIESNAGYCVPGNHDDKLKRFLWGKKVQIRHGLERSIEQLEGKDDSERIKIANFIDSRVSHYVLDDGKLVVSHAGLKEEMQGRGSGAVREFCMYGETTGETDEFGLPVRYDWASNYRGAAMVVYGHTPVPDAEWVNHTINIDTGCVFGGALTALRYPERDLVSVPAKMVYMEPAKPFLAEEDLPEKLSVQHQLDDVLDLEDVYGKKIINTRLQRNITVREENSAAALEVMSRFAANPKWLIYLPPTMSPCETSLREEYLEHPEEALAYFRDQGCDKAICQQKHMGSRAVVVICQNEETARQRFGVVGDGIGIVYTRTGRSFFTDRGLEQELLVRVRDAIEKAGLWQELETNWLCLDCELMPWSAKARELLRYQYAPVGSAGSHMLNDATVLLKKTTSRCPETQELYAQVEERKTLLSRYIQSYRAYCWSVASLDDYRLAPFHVLAGEKEVYASRDHNWHMAMASRMAETDEAVLMPTNHKSVDLTDQNSIDQAVDWWLNLTDSGGEGMVVKPLEFVVRGRKGLSQPAVKCRGREYLRIIYGPEYTRPENLKRLRRRALSRKRRLALREFALGIDALERFVRHEPLRKVHECVFGVLAMESETVDPRL